MEVSPFFFISIKLHYFSKLLLQSSISLDFLVVSMSRSSGNSNNTVNQPPRGLVRHEGRDWDPEYLQWWNTFGPGAFGEERWEEMENDDGVEEDVRQFRPPGVEGQHENPGAVAVGARGGGQGRSSSELSTVTMVDENEAVLSGERREEEGVAMRTRHRTQPKDGAGSSKPSKGDGKARRK